MLQLQRNLRKLVAEDLIYERQFGDLYLYVYSHRCMKERAWSDLTKMARGLILDADGKIICRPINKFFNLFERGSTEPQNLPDLPFSVEEKLDGSLINIWHRSGHDWNCSTKGSLEPEQANYVRENQTRP